MESSPNTKSLALVLVLMSVMTTITSAGIDSQDKNNSQPRRFAPAVSKGKCGIRPFDGNENFGHRMAESQKFTEVLNLLRQQKIVGGHDAARGEFPWQGRIKMFTSNGYLDPEIYCGATIISEFWLVSAAHCFEPSWKYRVVVGDHSRSRKDPGEQEFEVDVISHELYKNGYCNDYDIALIKIRPTRDGRGIQFNNLVQPACLPDSTTPVTEGTNCLISGWGLLEFDTPRKPDILNGALVPLVSQKKCESSYLNTFDDHCQSPIRITNRMICAGYDKGGVDTCTNDSGGPLVSKVGGVYTLLGATSFGGRCAVPNYPGVYVRVSEFLPWIQSKIRLHSTNRAERSIPRRP